jgi:hydrogenase expression/formation protein HypE
MKKENKILLSHGSGGKMSQELIGEIFVKYFDNEILHQQTDSAILNIPGENIAFTTDSYVVDPIVFPGGNIGKLAVCGTVNDLAVSGAVPKYISTGFILEEGLDIDILKMVVQTMGKTAKDAGVQIVTGDTKVVNKGQMDKVFVNTTGIGFLPPAFKEISTGKNIAAGDKILVNGDIGDHGIAILSARESLHFETPVLSDCAPLNQLIKQVLDAGIHVKFMRDATRGGLATVLNEIAIKQQTGVILGETAIPVREEVKGTCEIFGFDPLYLANEGKVVMVVDGKDAEKAQKIMKLNKYGKNASIIGKISNNHPGYVTLETSVGGSRIVDVPVGEQLPRIC